MHEIKSTYAKMLVSKKDSRYIGHPSYVQLDETPSGSVVGFTYTVPSTGIPAHIDLCVGSEWDKCHRVLSNDKKCGHGKWHSKLCAHMNDSSKCNCKWQNV